MNRNILLTTMSTLPGAFNTNYYYSQESSSNEVHPKYCDGIAQTEAGTKFFLATTRIDHIVVIGSDKTYCVDAASRDENIDCFETADLVAESKHYTGNAKNFAYRYYKYRIAQFLRGENSEQDSLANSIPVEKRRELEKLTSEFMRSKGFNNPKHWFDIIASKFDSKDFFDVISKNKDEISYLKSWLYQQLDKDYVLMPLEDNSTVSITFVPDTKLDKHGIAVYNVSEIIKAIKDCSSEDGTALELYIDMQGGSRTDGYVRNAILSILDKDTGSKIKIRQVIATNFEAKKFTSQVVNETDNYLITQLTAGMNAFIQYGRADLIDEYLHSNNNENNSHIERLVDAMVDIDHALSICNIDDLTKAINRIKKIFKEPEPSQISRHNEYFLVLKDGIRRDYGALVSKPELDYYELAKWAFRKGFLQQALTIIESKMPREFVRKGICYYSDSEREKNIQIFRDLFSQVSEKNADKNGSKGRDQSYYFKDVDSYFIKHYLFHTTTNRLKKPEEKSNQMKSLLNISNPKTIKVHTECTPTRMCSVLKLYYQISDLRNKVNHSKENDSSFTYKKLSKIINNFLTEYEIALSESSKKKFHVTPIKPREITKDK